jgi:hypothetical protein
VNGGQATDSIYAAVKKDKADMSAISVQVKPDDAARSRCDRRTGAEISLYANRHDNVNTADFSANHPSSRELVHDRDLGGSSGETRSQD